MDFALLPPEINSGRMYAGAGSGSMVAAAQAWGGLAAELNTAATSYQGVVSELTGGSWAGPSSTSMAAAVAPYVSWMNTTAAQAEQTANQLRSAAAAYEAAFMATVPPEEIEVNRALLASLVSTNVLGQNTPAIAATQAQYAEMWAQDAAAMYGYASASAAATTLTPVTAPTQNTNPAGTANQAAAVAQTTASSTGTSTQSALSSVPTMLQSLSSGGSSAAATNPISNLLLDFFNSSPLQAYNSLSTATSGYQFLSEGLNFDASGALLTIAPYTATAFLPLADTLGAPGGLATFLGSSGSEAGGLGAGLGAGLGSTLAGSYGSGVGAASAGLGSAGVSAGLGQAVSVGKLSVPQSWATPSPAIRLAATALPAIGLDGVPAVGAAGPGGFYGGMPMMGPVGSVVNAPRGGLSRPQPDPRRTMVPAIAGELGSAPRGDGAVSERDELDQLRKALPGIAKQRDVLKRTAALLIKEATRK